MRDEPGAQSTRFGPRLVGSVLGHVFVMLALFVWPTSAPPALPVAVTVNLLAALPAPPKPVAAPAPAPAPRPKPVQKKVVLPRRAPALKPKPKAQPKPVKRPSRVERPRREKVEALDYGDALDLLRKELGEERPVEPAESSNAEPVAAPSSQSTATASPEMIAWRSAARRHVRRRWVTPQEFLDRGLTTLVAVELTASGQVVGPPKVVRSSGDPFWDDNTVRAILAASPLPPPPDSGQWHFEFTPQERF